MNFSYPNRGLNSVFQCSTNRDTFVNYSVDISCVLSLSGGQAGTVFLEVADDDAFTTNVQELCRFVNGNTGTLTLGLNITQNCTAQLSGMVEAIKFSRIRTSGTGTFNYRSGQEAII